MFNIKEEVISNINKAFSVYEVISKRRSTISAANRSDLISAMSNFQKRLKELRREDSSFKSYLNNLWTMYKGQRKRNSEDDPEENSSTFSQYSFNQDAENSKKKKKRNANNALLAPIQDEKSLNSVVSSLEEKLGALQKASELTKDAQDLHLQVKSRFGDHKSAKKLINDTASLVESCKESQNSAKELITKVAKDQRPVYLTPKGNPIIVTLHKLIRSAMVSANAETAPELAVKEVKYMMDILPDGNIRFASFTPMDNIPTIDGNTIDIYLMVGIDLKDVKNIGSTDKIDNTERFGETMITFVEDIIRPQSAPKMYAIKNGKDIKNVLSFLARRYNITLFTGVPHGDPETRRKKLYQKLIFFKDKNITITSDGSLITAKIPLKKLKFSPNGEINSSVSRIMIKEMALIAGTIPSSLTIEKIQPKGAYVFVTFKVMPSKVKELPEAEDSATTEEISLSNNISNDAPTEIDNSKFMEELRKSIGEWM